MALEKIYAQLSCSDLTRAMNWFARLFGREPDARPMPGLAEWHHRSDAGFQLFEAEADAGRGTMTLIVSSLRADHARLIEAGLNPGDIESADTTSLVRLRDPDNNVIVLAQPGRPS